MVHVFPSSTDSTRKKGESMSTEQLEPDAWATFYKVRFEQQARELEGLARRMEAALSKPVDRESMLELVQDLYSKADELAEVGEVFSNEQ